MEALMLFHLKTGSTEASVVISAENCTAERL